MGTRKRPVDLGIFHSRLPVGAWVSILHRITGVILVLLFPAAFFLFEHSLTPGGFRELASVLDGPGARALLLVLVWVFAQHFFAGIRHLLLDADIGIERSGGRRGAFAVFIASALTAAIAGAAWL